MSHQGNIRQAYTCTKRHPSGYCTCTLSITSLHGFKRRYYLTKRPTDQAYITCIMRLLQLYCCIALTTLCFGFCFSALPDQASGVVRSNVYSNDTSASEYRDASRSKPRHQRSFKDGCRPYTALYTGMERAVKVWRDKGGISKAMMSAAADSCRSSSDCVHFKAGHCPHHVESV
jgi:hypothetical protein